MRHVLGRAVAAAFVLGLGSSAAPGQSPYAGPLPAPGPVAVEGVIALTPSTGPWSYPYAPLVLTPSASHPWVIVPTQGQATYGPSGLGYGFRTSPYGEFSRYRYYRSAPFPSLWRPPARFDTPHGQAH